MLNQYHPRALPQEHLRAKQPKTLLSFCHFVTIVCLSLIFGWLR